MRDGADQDIWVYEPATRLHDAFDVRGRSIFLSPVWTPDGRHSRLWVA